MLSENTENIKCINQINFVNSGIYIHTYIHTYMHTYTHTHTHTHTFTVNFRASPFQY